MEKQYLPLQITIPSVTPITAMAVRQRVCNEFKYAKGATPYAFLFPQLEQIQEYYAQVRAALPSQKIDAIIVVGIGGSQHGTQALYQAYQRTSTERPIPMMFCDTLASTTLMPSLDMLARAAQHGGLVVVCVVSKSGQTVETIINTRILCQELARYYGSSSETWNSRVVILSEDSSPLFAAAHNYGCSCIPLNPAIGGRFSVLSPVGCIPLALAGYDIQALMAGAQVVTDQVLSDIQKHDDAYALACWLYSCYQKGQYIHDLFLFDPTLKGLGAWYRQLLAESLGKHTNSGIPTGITPTLSIGTNDLHAMAQLYLAGPNNRCTTFVRVIQQGASHTLTKSQPFSSVIPVLDGHTTAQVYNATLQGTMRSYKHAGRPYSLISFNRVSEYSIGQFFQLHMVAIVYLAHMLKVNPFNQPQVEDYKMETRKVLAGE